MQWSFASMAKRFYLDEVNDHQTYAALAEHTPDLTLRSQISRIATMERRHADFWSQWLTARDEPLPAPSLSRGRLLCLRLTQKLVNPLMLVGLLEMSELASIKRYRRFLDDAPLEARERRHLQGIVVDELEHEIFFKKVAHTLGVTHMRDFILGMNDGLVEILGTVAGLSAVYPQQPLLVAISGLIVGVAGSLSMGIGAFSSVRSQRQVHDGARERLELLFTIAPERAMHAYCAELIASGIPPEVAEEIAEKLGANDTALRQLILQESDAHEVRSGFFTGAAYLVGVFFPVFPYFLASTSRLALPFAIASAGLLLISMAFVVALLSGVSVKQKIAEMLMAGFAAAGFSYAFGTLMQSVFGLHN